MVPADSMHIRADGQVEISPHDDLSNLFALEAGNRSVVDIYHANDGNYNNGEGRASAASLCVIRGEQDDISVLTDLFELPPIESDTEDDDRMPSPKSKRSTPASSPFSDCDTDSKSSLGVDLCDIDCFASTQWFQEQMSDCCSALPSRISRTLHVVGLAVGLWYQKLSKSSLRSKSSSGDAMKRLAEVKKMENKKLREPLKIITNTSPDATKDTTENAEEEELSEAESIVAKEILGERRDDTNVKALNSHRRTATDAEEREDDEGRRDQPLAVPSPTPLPKAPAGILKQSKYQPSSPSSVNSKRKTKKSPKASPTSPRRAPKSPRKYVDTRKKKSFWTSNSPKAVPAPGFKRQKGWTSSGIVSSDCAMMI